GPLPEPDGPAARPRVAGLRAPAVVRLDAPPHRGGAGQRRPPRPVADRRPRPDARIAHGATPGTQAQDPRNLRDGPGPAGGPSQRPRPRGRDASARQSRQAIPRRRARGATPRPRTPLVSLRRREEQVRPAVAPAHGTAR